MTPDNNLREDEDWPVEVRIERAATGYIVRDAAGEAHAASTLRDALKVVARLCGQPDALECPAVEIRPGAPVPWWPTPWWPSDTWICEPGSRGVDITWSACAAQREEADYGE